MNRRAKESASEKLTLEAICLKKKKMPEMSHQVKVKTEFLHLICEGELSRLYTRDTDTGHSNAIDGTNRKRLTEMN